MTGTAKELDEVSRWCRSTWRKLYYFIYQRVQNRQEAEELTQEVYARVLPKLDGLANLPSDRYLKTVSLNLIRDRWRQNGRRTLVPLEESLLQGGTVVEDVVNTIWLRNLFAKLPDEYRTVLRLRIIGGHSRTETARQMGRTEDAVRGLQYRALKQLRELFPGRAIEMTDRREQELDHQIDLLNREQTPGRASDRETAELLALARMVKSLRPPAKPRDGLLNRLLGKTAKRRAPRSLFAPAAAVVLLMLFGLVVGLLNHNDSSNIVQAMERAVSDLESYHGIIEVRLTNGEYGSSIQSRIEFWQEGDRYYEEQHNLQSGCTITTINNGEKRWQIRTSKREVAVLPLFPDARRESLLLQSWAARASESPHEVVGEEQVAGRKTIHIKITPEGGLPYDMWIDKQTKIPLRVRTAEINRLQSEWTYLEFEPDAGINQSLFIFSTPPGYEVITENTGELVNTPGEAALTAGFTPVLPDEPPLGILAFADRISLDYGDTAISEQPHEGQFIPRSEAAQGTAGSGPLEVTGEELRFLQEGVLITIKGPRAEALARDIEPNLVMPDPTLDLVSQAQIKVDVDLERERARQIQVDGGHMPWRLDPVQVALTFVNVKLSQDGRIDGSGAVSNTSLRVVANTGCEAVVELAAGPIARVYLKRLVREDSSGIWSTVGYDLR